MERSQLISIETEKDYEQAFERYDQVKYADNGSEENLEKLRLAILISEYENSIWDLPEVEPSEIIRILKVDFGR